MTTTPIIELLSQSQRETIASKQAFNEALELEFLQNDKNHKFYVGHYMYMGTTSNMHSFKHIMTREYFHCSTMAYVTANNLLKSDIKTF